MSKKLTLFLLLIYSVTPMSVRAQVVLANSKLANPYSSLKTLAQYQPSLFASEESALAAYKLLPTEIFRDKSQCYQRAHVWAHLLDEQFGIKSMKVYLYFTDRYRREFDYSWYFHTAPIIPTLMKDGTIQDLVFDPTFTSTPHGEETANYSDKPIPISEWVHYFIYPKAECKTVDNYADFEENQDAYYCYIMKAPMYNFNPNNFKFDSQGKGNLSRDPQYDPVHQIRTGWRAEDLANMRDGLK